MTYYIYIIHSQGIDRYYIGYSSNPWNRLQQHLENSSDKYTGKVKDWYLQAIFEVSEKESEVMRIERFILSRQN